MKNMDTSKIDYKARNAKSVETNLKKRGVENPNQDPNVVAKSIKTKKEKYGKDFGKIIAAKSMKTYLKNTGYSNPRKNPIVIKKNDGNKDKKFAGWLFSFYESF